MPENIQTLDKDKILSTTSRRILFDCLLKGMIIKDAAQQAGYSYRYARNLVANSGMNTLALQTRAEISAKTGITVEKQQLSLMQDIESAREAKAWGAVMSGHATLLKSIGGMTGDRPHPEMLAAKRDAKQDEFLLAVAERVYAERYLAKSVEQPTVLDLRPLAGPTGDDYNKDGVNHTQSMTEQITPL